MFVCVRAGVCVYVYGLTLTRSLRLFAQGEEPPNTGGGRVFSLDATSGLLDTRWRLWRRGGSSALRSACVM